MIKELAAGVVWLLFAGSMFMSTFGYRDVGSLAAIGPAYWPRILLSGMIVLSLLSIFRAVRDRHGKEGSSAAQSDGRLHPHLFWVTIGLTFAYILALPYLGFGVGTVGFLLLMLRAVGVRGKIKLPLLALGLSLCLIVVFANFMSVPLPRGEGVFHHISLWFY